MNQTNLRPAFDLRTFDGDGDKKQLRSEIQFPRFRCPFGRLVPCLSV
jgi:hypothetical protein